MFEKVSQVAERVATSASRRQFLGRVGRGAMAVAAAVGGLLALSSDANAAGHRRACDASSHLYCRGLVEGAYCQIGTTGGTCVGAPACYCRPSRPRGGGR
jgi:hypothetical protein